MAHSLQSLLKLAGLILLGVLAFSLGSPAAAQTEPLLIPMGGGYSDVYAGFSEAAVARAHAGAVNILVLPLPYASNPETISEAERADNLQAAEERRFQIEEACKRAAPTGVTCTASLAPILVRADALDPANQALFTDDLSAIFILGGAQGVAMQVIAETPIEEALAQAYQRGVIIAGTSAGAGMQAAAMLADYNANFAASSSLDFGAVEVWNTSEQHGLLFGVSQAILDQHFFQRGRLGRLLNAIALPGVPQVGVGIDAYTGVQIAAGTRLQNVFGLYGVAVLDAQTYHAADAVQYRGLHNTLSLRNVLVHLLAPGKFTYDLATRQHSLGAPAPTVTRSFEALALPASAGPLILAGNLSDSLENNPILDRFVELCGGAQANILVVGTGYSSENTAQRAADRYAKALGVSTQTLVIAQDSSTPPVLPTGITGILVLGRDQSMLPIAALASLKEAWLAGMPLLADNAAAAAMGQFFSAHEPTPEEGEEAELAAQKSFLRGRTTIRPGVGLLSVMAEPQTLANNRWGRIFSLAYAHPDQLTLGLVDNTAIEFSAQTAKVLGERAIVVLDLRSATLDLGINEGYVIANGLMDVFGSGERIEPVNADMAATPQRAPTPLAPAPVATAAPAVTIAPLTATPYVPSGEPGASWLPIILAVVGFGILLLVGGVLWRRRANR
jgi:cyanophycinase